MAWVTKDQIQRAREVDVLDYVLTHERDNVRRVGSSYRLKDHPSISIDKGEWYWHSREIGGKTALDYLTDVHGYGLVDAVCMLIGERPLDKPPPDREPTKPSARKITPKALSPPAATERKPFKLPPRNVNNARVVAYLQSRGIERSMILACIQKRLSLRIREIP